MSVTVDNPLSRLCVLFENISEQTGRRKGHAGYFVDMLLLPESRAFSANGWDLYTGKLNDVVWLLIRGPSQAFCGLCSAEVTGPDLA